MSTKTRNLQAFFRALRSSSQDSDLSKAVAAELAKCADAEPHASASGLHAAVEIVDD